MIGKSEFTQSDLFTSSVLGTLRGLTVQAVIYPLEVIKIRQQCLRESELSFRVAYKIFKEEGYKSFYQGVTRQLVRTSLKQVWTWPMITGVPVYLKPYNIGEKNELVLTGLSIATVDAFLTTPLERNRIRAASSLKIKESIFQSYRQGWHGVSYQWVKLSVGWSTFLVTQKHFRDMYRDEKESSLSLSQMAKVGVKAALLTTFVTAPFDVVNTRILSNNSKTPFTFSVKGVVRMFRGWPIQALAQIINSIASVTLIEKISIS